jgi:hypothetical protein
MIFQGGRGDIGDHIQTKTRTAAIQAASSIMELLLFFKRELRVWSRRRSIAKHCVKHDMLFRPNDPIETTFE